LSNPGRLVIVRLSSFRCIKPPWTKL